MKFLGELDLIPLDTSCNLCGFSEFHIIEDSEKPFHVLKCKNCSLVFIHPHPEQTDLKNHYDEGYFNDWIQKQRIRREKIWASRLAKIEKFRSNGYLLDVGCGVGTFLQLAKQRGWRVSGTELSNFAVNFVSQLLDEKIFHGELFDAAYPNNTFDIITLWHVLEHVKDPKRYLKEVHRIIKKNGLLVVAVPNVNNLIMKIAYRIIKRKKLKLFTKGEKELHLYHFSPSTLNMYLKKVGFECLSFSPDFGIVETSKRLINFISVIFYYFSGVKIFNAMTVIAKTKK